MSDPVYTAPFLCLVGSVVLFVGITRIAAAAFYPSQIKLPGFLVATKGFTVLGQEAWRRPSMVAEGLIIAGLGVAAGMAVYARASVDGDVARICPIGELVFGVGWIVYLLLESSRVRAH
jgi:hypothetical protein